jgi:hypothetical protein
MRHLAGMTNRGTTMVLFERSPWWWAAWCHRQPAEARPSWLSPDYRNIQAAVTAAEPGDTIRSTAALQRGSCHRQAT